MMDERYNGWTNYETWLYNLYLNHNYYIELVKDYEGEVCIMSVGWLANYLRDECDEWLENNGILSEGFICDLVYNAISKVNWYEIAENIIEGA